MTLLKENRDKVRDEVYNENSEDAGIMEINITKNRHGPTGMINDMDW